VNYENGGNPNSVGANRPEDFVLENIPASK
jgi:hypothetical protein